MQDLQTFDFEGDPVRIEDRDGEPWFVGKDVCRCLDISNHRDALSRLDDDEKDGVGITDPIGRNQTTTIISAAGVYQLVFTSRTEAAERFKRWLAHDVLPAIRRTGSYGETGMTQMLSDDPRVVRLHLEIIREIRCTFGRGAAQRLWRQLPLPEVEDGPQQIAGGDHAIGRFMAERTQQGDALKVRASQLYAAYAVWCGLNGVAAASLTMFGRALGEGFVKNKDGGVIWYEGVALA